MNRCQDREKLFLLRFYSDRILNVVVCVELMKRNSGICRRVTKEEGSQCLKLLYLKAQKGNILLR